MNCTLTAFGHILRSACAGAALLLTLTILSIAPARADSLSTTSIIVGPEAGATSVIMLSPSSSTSWFNGSTVPWATVPSNSAYPNDVVPITIAANTGATRTGTLTINFMTLTITQLGSTFASASQAFTLFTSGSDSITGISVNAAGDVYFTDTVSPSLKKWTKSSNTISTLVNSIIISPRGIAVDALGTAYISDVGASAVWKWTSGGGLTVQANVGVSFPVTVALNDYNGLVIGSNDSVKTMSLPAGTLGASVSGTTGAQALAVNAQGNIYYSKFNSPQITKRTRLGTNNTTFNFTGTSDIRGLAVDASGDTYISDVDTSSVMKRVAGSGAVSTLVSTGLSTPINLALDSARTLYIADSGNHAVKTFPQAFVDTKKISIGLDPGSASVAVVQPTTFDLVAPYVPTSDQSWLTVSPTTGGNVALSWTGTATPRYAYLTVLGRQILVQQGQPTNPQAATAPATNLAATSATLNGNVTSDGGGPVSERGIYWSTAIGFGINDPGVIKVPASTNGPGAYSVNITGLQPGSTYYFRAYVLTQAGGIGISQYDTFVTATATPATFATPTATDFSAITGAITIGANITAAGNTPVTSRGLVFSTTADNSNPQVGAYGCTSFTDAGTGIGAYSRVITGLLPATQYAFRAWAVNLSGTTYSSIVTFTTPAPSFALATTSLTEGPSAGSSSVVLIVTPASAAWSATANDSWIHLINGNGNGSSVVSFTLDANTGSTRTGTLTIAGMTLTVTQAPAGYAAVNRVTQLGTALASQTGGVAVDASGNVFADPTSGTLMRWTPASNAWTQVGTLTVDTGSQLAADTAGNVFISATPTSFRRLDKWTAPSGPVSGAYPNAGTPGVAGFYASKIATDSQNNVWLIDGSISRYNPVTNVMTSMFGVPANNTAISLALDGADNVYVLMRSFYTFYYTVIKWSPATGAISTVIPEDTVNNPQTIAVDVSGNVYLNQPDIGTVVKWTTATSTLSTVVTGLTPADSGTGAARVGQIALDRSGNLYVADNNRIVELPRAFVPSSQILVGTAAGSATLPAVVPNTAVALAPFTPVAEDSWLHIDSNTAGSVGYSWDTSATARYGYLKIGGQRILVLQGTAATPSVSTPTANSISTLLDFSGNITSDGGAPITARGFALALTSDNPNPQIGGTGVVVLNDPSAATGSFTARATGISPNTRYTFTAFATNNTGTTYSAPVTVLTNALDLSLTIYSTGLGTTAVQQPDGMTVIYSGGYLTRYYTDNTIDFSLFVNLPTGTINAMLSLSDGSLIVAGSFSDISNTPRNNMAKYDLAGTVNSFAPNVNGVVRCMALQRDGNILIGGDFTQVNGIARNRIARLYPNGTLDLTFNPNANGPVRSIAEQTDGKLLLGGDFTLIGTSLCNRLARVSTLGVVDATFVANADAVVNAITLLPDNSILVGGGFSTINSIARANLAHLNPNGTLDNSFTATPNGAVNSIALQADGKMLLGGSFTLIGTTVRLGFARLLADGSVDALHANATAFDFTNGIDKDATVNGVTVLEDGKIIIAGDIFKVAGGQVQNAARLFNDEVTQTLAPTGSTGVEWLRGTTLPEAIEVAFDISTDSGNTWTVLGNGTRTPDGWALGGLSSPLPETAYLRGRARIASGFGNGSGGWNYFEAPYTLGAQEIVVEQPENTLRTTGDTIDIGTLGLNVPVLTTFTVRNSGGFDLTGINVSIIQPLPAVFSVTKKPDTTLTSLDSTEFIVQAKLTSSGPKTATMMIASNDGDENPFFIYLTATGAAAVLPVVATIAPPTSISYDTATVTGTVDAKGSLREVFFDYGLTTTYSDTVAASTPTTATSGTFSAVLPDLLPHKLYNYRIRAAGDLGNASGVNKTFTTLNNTPAANADTVVVLPGAVATIDALANDTDADDDTLTITAKSAVTPLTAGTVAIVGNQLVFTAKTTFTGSATFTYTISDGFSGTATGTVTVSAGGPPTLSPGSLNVPSAAGDYDVTITTNGAWAVAETPAIAWASQSQTRGSGTTTFKVSVLANTALAARSGHIFIGGVDLPITQAAVAAPAIGPLSGTFNTIVGESYSLAIPTTNAPVVYVVTGTMPPGLTLTQATGVISGVPTAPGTYPLKVRANNAAGTATATGAATQPNLEFTIVVASLPAGSVGTFHGYVARSATAKFTTTDNMGARFEMTTQSNGTVSGSVIEGVTKKSFTGAKLVSRSGTPSTHTLTAPLTGTTLFVDITLDPSTNTASGVLRNVSGLSSAAITAWRSPWSTVAPLVKATNYKAQHNFRIENLDPANGPQGYGYGSFIVTEKDGTLTISGKLPDGSALGGSTFVGANGEVLIYQSLNANRASCFGKLVIDATGANKPLDNTLTGTLTWRKPASLPAAKDYTYGSGFGITTPLSLEVKGGTFIAPPKGGRLLDALDQPDNAQLFFGTAGADGGFPQLLRITNPNNVTGTTNVATMSATNPNIVAMPTLTFGTGVFAGSYKLAGPRNATFFGEIVTIGATTAGYGFHLLPTTTAATSPKLSGKVDLTKQ